MISHVTCSVAVVAPQDGRNNLSVTEWPVRIDQVPEAYNSDTEFETSPSVLMGNCIILNYPGACYMCCYMSRYACAKRQQTILSQQGC
jgi:hypothetical protein